VSTYEIVIRVPVDERDEAEKTARRLASQTGQPVTLYEVTLEGSAPQRAKRRTIAVYP
jgi:type IV secretory pathway ATPase VirB11/archaellum biosynthesis ATPase